MVTAVALTRGSLRRRGEECGTTSRPPPSTIPVQYNDESVFERPEDVPQPGFTGRRVVVDASLAEIAEYIDWTFFFSTWELKGKLPKIFEHPKYGEQARELYDDGAVLLQQIVDEKLLTAQPYHALPE